MKVYINLYFCEDNRKKRNSKQKFVSPIEYFTSQFECLSSFFQMFHKLLFLQIFYRNNFTTFYASKFCKGHKSFRQSIKIRFDAFQIFCTVNRKFSIYYQSDWDFKSSWKQQVNESALEVTTHCVVEGRQAPGEQF